MTYIIKPLTTQMSITTANTVGNNVLIRVENPTVANVGVAVSYANGTIYGQLTVGPYNWDIIEKGPTDRLTAPGLTAVAIAYQS